MNCPKCRSSVGENSKFCPICGTDLRNVPQWQGGAPNYQGQPYHPVYQMQNGKDYTPISAFGYLGYELLFSIPIVGFILLLIFALGGTNNVNLRNFARSYFCLILVIVILIVVFSASIIASLSDIINTFNTLG